MSDLKIPPHDKEAEKAVLGCLLIEPKIADEVIEKLISSDFYVKSYSLIYQTIQDLYKEDKEFDIICVSNYLRDKNILDKVGGAYAITTLCSDIPTAAHIMSYVNIVKNKSILRKLIRIGSTLVENSFNCHDPIELLNETESKICNVNSMTSDENIYTDMSDVCYETYKYIKLLYEKKGQIIGIPSGFSYLDHLTAGFQKGDLIIMAGRPAMGKAQDVNSLVLTIGGFKKMGDITIGEKLQSIDADESIVSGIFPQGVKQLYEIKFIDGSKTNCTLNHLWKVYYRKHINGKVVTTKQIIKLLNLGIKIFVDKFNLENKTVYKEVLESIKKIHSDEAICISVTHFSNLYITDDFICTHNTTMALNCSVNAAKAGKKVAIVSLEMNKQQLNIKMLSSESRLDSNDLRRGNIKESDWSKISFGFGVISRLPIFIIDNVPDSNFINLRTRLRKLHNKEKLDMIVIDYLQLISSYGGGKSENRQQDVSNISRGLKMLAMEMNIPIIALAQLSRGVERRQDKRPMLSDLRESGSIEQDSDLVTFLFRPGYYDNSEESDKSYTEFIVAKQRSGPLGNVYLSFIPHFNNFIPAEFANYDENAQ